MESREPQVSEHEYVERRRDERVNQPESVKVWVDEPGAETEFQAVLVNISCSGFAIRHWRKELSVGQRVRIALLSKGEIVARCDVELGGRSGGHLWAGACAERATDGIRSANGSSLFRNGVQVQRSRMVSRRRNGVAGGDRVVFNQ